MIPSRFPESQHIRSLIKRDGNLNVHGPRNLQERIRDIYHYLFSLSWPKFFIHVLGGYLFINLIFGVFYFLLGVTPVDGHGLEGWARFKEDFFLSVETLTAIDYGRIQPSGWLTYVLKTMQALLGILTLAIITGLFYARFSRPMAKLIFSNKAIIGSHNGVLYFYFRVANQRLNQIAEARITLTMSQNEVSKEGEYNRKFYNLKLDRDYSPLFALSWTVRHPIDKDSPLHGMTEKAMRDAQITIGASLTGIDETFSQPIIGRHVYTVEDIVYKKRFKDIIQWHDRRVFIDIKSIHEVYEED